MEYAAVEDFEWEKWLLCSVESHHEKDNGDNGSRKGANPDGFDADCCAEVDEAVDECDGRDRGIKGTGQVESDAG
jgi:hypothetical protein